MIPKEMIEAMRAALDNRGCIVHNLSDETLEAALTAALSSQWRGIESAPKDGTSILLWSEMWEHTTPILLGWWSDYVNAKQGGWVTENIGIYKWPAEDQPMRWQPLPPPPAQE